MAIDNVSVRMADDSDEEPTLLCPTVGDTVRTTFTAYVKITPPPPGTVTCAVAETPGHPAVNGDVVDLGNGTWQVTFTDVPVGPGCTVTVHTTLGDLQTAVTVSSDKSQVVTCLVDT